MAAIYVILLVSLASCYCNAQVSFNRACDCDYYIDGKCAYTLLLPTGGSDDTCPSSGETYTELVDMITKLSNNLTTLSLWSGEQARLLGQLQGTVIDQQTTIQNLQTPSNENDDEIISDLQSQISDQSSTISTLQSNIVDLQANYQTMQGSVSDLMGNVDSLLAEADGITASLATISTTVNAQASQIATDFWLCNTRGRLVSGIGNILNAAVSASSSLDEMTTATYVNILAESAWCTNSDAETEPNMFEWVQFDLGLVRVFYGIITKGRFDYTQWVTSYKMAYTNETPEEADSWTTYTDLLGEEQIFPGNVDQNSPQVNMLVNPVMARYVRIIPLTGYADSNLCMRVDLIGCVDV